MSGEHEHAGLDEWPGDRTDRRRRLMIGAAVAAVVAGIAGTAFLGIAGGGEGGGVHPVAPIMPSHYAGPKHNLVLPAPALPSGSGSYQLTGALPDDVPGPTPLYRPAAGGPDRTAVTRLASALGLTGPVADDGTSWRVGPRDGTGPALLVAKDAPGVWSYARNGQGAPASRTVVPERQAWAVAAPVLDALGQSDAEVGASRTAGTSRTVTADPVVGGLPTRGWETAVTVTQDGVVGSAHGHLAQLVAGERKSVVGAERAFEELPARQPMHPGGTGCRSGGMTDAGVASTACATAPATRGVPVDVSGARFGLSPQFLAGGGQALVPSWLFTATPEGSPTSYVLAQPAMS
ncbi:hypothetical protein [Streptomyces sp. NPDC021020]|uniref:hypothetical protein n=1 Tax=Streptomyces sp. NPDC021020 TaxID=3365109 RepID=UPI0037B70431